MTPSLHPLRAKLAAGRTLAGIWSVIPSAPLVGTLAASGFDFVILDAEHGGYDFGSLDAAITACEDGGASPLVRSPGADAFFIQRALDLGADGVVVPQVADEAAAARAVAMMHYAPLGTRGYNPFTRGGRLRGVAPLGKTWMNGSTLRVRFIGGTGFCPPCRFMPVGNHHLKETLVIMTLIQSGKNLFQIVPFETIRFDKV